MSLIADALHKAQQDRAEAAARASAVRYPRTPRPPRHPAGDHALRLVGIATVATFALLIGAIFYFPIGQPATIARESFAANASLTSREAAPAAVSPALSSPTASSSIATGASPFTPPTATPDAPVPAAANSDYSLAGMTEMGRDTLLSVLRHSDRRSVWIPVGKTVGLISAVSYDPAADRAVIRVNGELLTITMNSAPAPTEPATVAE